MRILSLFFPRLGVQILRATRPERAGHPVGLLAGEGDGALLAAASVEARSPQDAATETFSPGFAHPQNVAVVSR